MSNFSITDYFKTKSVKLTDSFTVVMQRSGGEEILLYNVIGFTLPKYEFEEDIIYYGNTSQKFLIPKYDSIKELSLEFIETKDNKIANLLGINSGSKFGGTYSLTQKMNVINGFFGYTENKGTYSRNPEFNKLEIRIYNNNFTYIPIKHVFENLKMIKADMYSLSYTDEAPCKISATFEFEKYCVETMPEVDEYDLAISNMIPSEPKTVGGADEMADEIAKKQQEEQEQQQMQQQSQPSSPAENTTLTGLIDNKLSKDAAADYKNFVKQLQATDSNFDPNKSSFTIVDMAKNRKYYIQDGKIVHEAFAATAYGDAAVGGGEAAEGVYTYKELGGGKHDRREEAVKAVVKELNISDEQLTNAMIKNKSTVIDTLSSLSNKSAKDIRQMLLSKNKDVKSDFYDNFYFASDYEQVKGVDVGTKNASGSSTKYYTNAKGGENKRATAAGIHQHAIQNKDLTGVNNYITSSEGNYTNEVTDTDIAIRKTLTEGKTTEGCIVMRPEDLVWDKYFREKANGKVYEIRTGGTSETNTSNNK